jgi:hypothetical protein
MLPGQKPVERFVFNAAQRRIHQAILTQREAGYPPRIVCLKARQPGASTLGLAYQLVNALCFPYSQSIFLAHDDESTVRLFLRLKFMLENLPEGLRPKLASERRKELQFAAMECVDAEVQLRTLIAVHTAKGSEAWRSMTPQAAHVSEAAQIPYFADILLGLMQGIPRTPQSLVIVESTAQGMDNDFHTLYQTASAGDRDMGFVPVFIPWFDIPEYRMTVPLEFELDDREREMKRAFGLEDSQLQWRRWTIHTDCQGDEDRFEQEYPSSPATAFLASGRPAFNMKRLQMMYEPAREAPRQEGMLLEETGLPKFAALRGGPLTIYKMPVGTHEYCIGADPSAGVEGGDPSAIQVFDRTTGEQVAVWHGYLNPVPFAAEMVKLGLWYNHAILAPEMNGGYGFSVIAELKSVQYLQLYVWQRVDRVRHTITNWYGWETNHRTRPLMIDTFAHAINEGDVKLWDLETINEALAFQYVDGRPQGQGKHDDLIMAMMIAFRVHLEMPMVATGLPPRVKYGDVGSPAAAAEALPPLPTGFSREAWKETDEELQRMKGEGKSTANEYGVPDAEPGEDPSFYPMPGGEY